MASTSLCVSLLLLVSLFLKPLYGFQINDVLSPLLSPVFDDICKNVECGKGNCRASSSNVFLFECVCQPGWKQIASNQTDNLKMLPCIIPNCTMDYSCTKTPPPSHNKSIKPDETIFDPCYWSYCGVGSCNKTSKFSYNCECPAGFNNLLNVSSLPCFQSCEMGMDCTNLGISSTNGTSSTNPAFDDKSYSSIQGRSFWSIIALTFVIMVVLKLD